MPLTFRDVWAVVSKLNVCPLTMVNGSAPRSMFTKEIAMRQKEFSEGFSKSAKLKSHSTRT